MRLFILLMMLSHGAWADITLEDYQGTVITLERPAQRVIGLAPHVVENLFSAGGGERVVGVVSYSNFPEAATRLPIVGDYRRTNYELITQLKPDLIVAWHSGRYTSVVNKLRELGFAVYVDDPHTLEDVARSIRDIGRLMGTESASETVVAAYLQRLSALRQRYADRPPVRVFYQVWLSPLQTLNGEHIISDVIRMCGGENIFANEASLAPKVNIEAVIARQPQVIIGGGTSEDLQQWQAHWQAWSMLDAVRNQHIFTIPSDLISRHTIRLLDGATQLCEQVQIARNSRVN